MPAGVPGARAYLNLTAGAVTTTPGLAVRPIQSLEVRLFRGGELLGTPKKRRAPRGVKLTWMQQDCPKESMTTGPA